MSEHFHNHKAVSARENSLAYENFDYPANDVIDPNTAWALGCQVGGAGTTGYNHATTNYAAEYSPVVGTASAYKRAGSDHYLYYSEEHARWELATSIDGTADYYSEMDNDIWGTWVVAAGASPAPVVVARGLVGKRSGRGWSGSWYRNAGWYGLGISDGQLAYTKNRVDLKGCGKMLRVVLTPSAWPDATATRLIDLAKMPSHLRVTSGAGNLGRPGTTLWYSYVTEFIGASLPATRWLGIKPHGSAGWFGRNVGNANWGIELPKVQSSTAITLNVTHLAVQRVVFAADASKCVTSLWIDPTPAIHPLETAPVETADIEDADMNYFTTDRIVISISNSAKFGMLRIGETYFSVAPGQRGLES